MQFVVVVTAECGQVGHTQAIVGFGKTLKHGCWSIVVVVVWGDVFGPFVVGFSRFSSEVSEMV